MAREPSNLRRGGILLARLPCRHAVAFHRVSRVTVVRLSFDQLHLASAMVCHRALMALLQDSPRMEVTAVRAASQCKFHHRRPQKSGVCHCLNSRDSINVDVKGICGAGKGVNVRNDRRR